MKAQFLNIFIIFTCLNCILLIILLRPFIKNEFTLFDLTQNDLKIGNKMIDLPVYDRYKERKNIDYDKKICLIFYDCSCDSEDVYNVTQDAIKEKKRVIVITNLENNKRFPVKDKIIPYFLLQRDMQSLSYEKPLVIHVNEFGVIENVLSKSKKS